MDVLPRRERRDEARILGQVCDAAQLDLVVVRDEECAAGCGTNARRNCRPSSERMGMLCRLGWSDDNRPVLATVWLNVAWMRPSAATSASSPSP